MTAADTRITSVSVTLEAILLFGLQRPLHLPARQRRRVSVALEAILLFGRCRDRLADHGTAGFSRP